MKICDICIVINLTNGGLISLDSPACIGQMFKHTYEMHSWPAALIHQSTVTHMCISELVHHWLRKWLVSSYAPSHDLIQRCLLLMGSMKTSVNEISTKIRQTSFKKLHLAMLSATRGPICLCLNVLSEKYLFFYAYISHNKPLTHFPQGRISASVNPVSIGAWRLFGAKPLSKPMMGYCQLVNIVYEIASILSRGRWVNYRDC